MENEKYIINKNKSRIDVFGYNQKFDDKDKVSLWDNHQILYLSGIMAVWVEKLDKSNTVVHLMQEDDGHLFCNKEQDICFNERWLDNYINTLTVLKTKLN